MITLYPEQRKTHNNYVKIFKFNIIYIANFIMFVFVIIVMEKYMIIGNNLSDIYNRLGAQYNNGNRQIKQEIPPLTRKQKNIILLSSAVGMTPVMAVLAAKKGFSLNPLKILKTPIKDWAIFKYAPQDKAIEFKPSEIIAVASGSVVGGFVGGSIVDDKSNLKAKRREVLNQILGNVIIPVECVKAGAKLYTKYQDKIEGMMPQIKNKSGRLVSVINAISKKLPNAVGSLAFLGTGIYLGNKVSNFINNHLYHKKVERDIKVSDFAPHVDDLCLAATMMNEGSLFGSIVGRVIPLALLVPGYQTGTTRQK